MNYQEELEEAVNRHNALIDEISEIETLRHQKTTEVVKLLGRIECLKELIESNEETEAKEETGS